ncbi:hypothetical protein U1Q18_010669 [Sarracenia purpurea var. burkii]
MEFRLWMTLLLVFSAVAEPSAVFDGATWGTVAQHDLDHSPRSDGAAFCGGQVGDCIGDAEETIMDSEVSRRTLTQSQRLISLKAYKKNHTPCPHRGSSYYDCSSKGGGRPSY